MYVRNIKVNFIMQKVLSSVIKLRYKFDLFSYFLWEFIALTHVREHRY